MTETLTLPARLDLTTVRQLAADLRRAADGPLLIDAASVEMLGGLGLQTLLAAQQAWTRAGHSLRLGPRSEAFDKALAQFGVTPGQLTAEG